MSELINNREERQKLLKEVILELHHGKSVDEVKKKFNMVIDGLGESEIVQMEQALIKEGIQVDEIKRLCDVHVEVFKDQLDKVVDQHEIPGHPVYTFKQENRAIEKVINEQINPNIDVLRTTADKKTALHKLKEGLNLLMDVGKHYSRKENLLFPYLEKYGVTGPSKVMWSHQDDIRAKLKRCMSLYNDALNDENIIDDLINNVNEAVKGITDMIYKEEKILFRTSMELLSPDEWGHIKEQSSEIGYCLIEPEDKWSPAKSESKAKEEEKENITTEKYLKFETGILTLDEINAIFNHLPVDITFVDKDDIVKYFSNSKERIFTRTKAIIGRNVQNCHPPASMHVVEKIVDDFKSGKRDHADFWIRMGDIYAYIRYFAVRDAKGEYVGTLEVTQNIKEIKEIQGEKRLLD